MDKISFEDLVAEHGTGNFTGWDFSAIAGRWDEAQPSWNYREMVSACIGKACTLLDMHTGGGEFLSSLPSLPTKVCAIEAYLPNVHIAKERLTPLGIDVVQVENDETLPFEDNQFDLIINRHGTFYAPEVFRVLAPNGILLTQQVGRLNNVQLNKFLSANTKKETEGWDLARAKDHFVQAGFSILEEQEEYLDNDFADIGAVVFYLRAIPWQILDFSIEKYEPQLRELHELIKRDGKFSTRAHRYLLKCTKKITHKDSTL